MDGKVLRRRWIGQVVGFSSLVDGCGPGDGGSWRPVHPWRQPHPPYRSATLPAPAVPAALRPTGRVAAGVRGPQAPGFLVGAREGRGPGPDRAWAAKRAGGNRALPDWRTCREARCPPTALVGFVRR